MMPLPVGAVAVLCERHGQRRQASEHVLRRYGSTTVFERAEHPFARFHLAENERFTLLLQGHLYCKSAASLRPLENLEILLTCLHRDPSFPRALGEVAGGLFSLFCLDHATAKVSVAVDRLGCMPLFFRESPDGVLFTNNQFVFAEEAAFSEVIAAEYLKYGYLPFSDSLFESVQRVQPGQVLTVSYRPEFRLVPGHGEPGRADAIGLPKRYVPPAERIQKPVEGARLLVDALDRYFGRLARKFPRAAQEFGWQFLFASRQLSTDPRTGDIGRHHVHEGALARAITLATRKADLNRHVGCHTLRMASPPTSWNAASTSGRSRFCSATRAWKRP